MNNVGLDRRQVLSGVGIVTGAVAVGTLGLASPALADGGDDNGGVTGSFLVNRQSDNDPTDTSMAVVSLAGGNVVIVHDINPAGPPFTGTWARQHDHGFRATFYTGFAGGPGGPPGPPPIARVHAEGQVHKSEISGTYDLAVLDAVTNETLQTDTGTFSGTRISA